MPAFNEAEGIGGFLEEISAACSPEFRCTFVLVDDASSDETVHVARSSVAASALRVHRNAQRSGHGQSTLTALRLGLSTGAPVIVALDGDGQFRGVDVRDLVRQLRDHPSLGVVEGVRRGRGDRAYRRLTSAITRLLVWGRCRRMPRDANTPLRVYRRDFLQSVLTCVPSATTIPNLFISVLTRRGARPYLEMEVQSLPRRAASSPSSWGRTKFRLPPARFIRFCRQAAWEWVSTRIPEPVERPRAALSRSERLTTVGLVTTTSVVTIARTAASGPDTVTDTAVWIPVHEWLSRGGTLYTSVWDHKDWGFFWFTHPFYATLHITGIYLAALLAVFMFGLGAFLLVRPRLPGHHAIALASCAVLAYVAYPSFFATHTENMAVGPMVLGLALLRRHPLLAGALLAGSSSIKVSGVAVSVAVVAVSLFCSALEQRHHADAGGLGRPVRFLVGYIVTGGVLVILAARQGALPGWLDVVGFNREYQELRGFPPDVALWKLPGAALGGAIVDLASLAPGDLLVLGLLATSALIGLLATRRQGGLVTPATRHDLRIVACAAAISGLAVIAQRPIAHHWVYLLGPLTATVAVAYSALAAIPQPTISGASRFRPALAAIAIVGIAVLATSAIVSPVLRPQSIVFDLRAWSSLEAGGALTDELHAFSSGVSVATFGTNNRRVDYRALPPGSELACRFFYQFGHMMPRYGTEIGSCLADERPAVVLVEVAPAWGNASLRQAVANQLVQGYASCQTAPAPYEVWVRHGTQCPL